MYAIGYNIWHVKIKTLVYFYIFRAISLNFFIQFVINIILFENQKIRHVYCTLYSDTILILDS